MSNLLLSVIIPAYNEEGRIGSTLDQIVSYLQSRNLNFELLVIDDGSQDLSREMFVTSGTETICGAMKSGSVSVTNARSAT